MNRHLTSRAITSFLASFGATNDDRHLRECAACQAELASFQSSLALFRDSIRHWSEFEEHRNAMVSTTENHLDCFIVSASLDEPWYRDFAANLREAVSPASLPPLEVTSRPIPVREIWGLYGRQKKSWLLSLAFQTLVVAVLFATASNPTVRQAARPAFDFYVPLAMTAPKPKTQGGGGGGGRSVLPPSKGRLPKPALKQFTPPAAVTNNLNPKLTVDPSIVAPPDMALPQIALNNDGDSLAKLGTFSNGPGSGGGVGSGKDGGVGPGFGPGAGPGSGGGFNDALYRLGAGVSAPVLLYKVEPDYSEEARKARHQGTVVLNAVIDATGHVANPQVVRSLGLGLDEKALEAVTKWRFKPASKDGKPVAVTAEILVTFHLL